MQFFEKKVIFDETCRSFWIFPLHLILNPLNVCADCLSYELDFKISCNITLSRKFKTNVHFTYFL